MPARLMRPPAWAPILVGLLGCTVSVSPPFITEFTPKAGRPGDLTRRGDMVQIRGGGLSETTRVEFAGIPAFFSIVTDDLLVAEVPSRAAGGLIRVTTSGGTTVSAARFSVFTEFGLWAGARPRAVAVGLLGSLWVTDASGALGVLPPNALPGTLLQSQTLPWAGGRPAGLTATPLGSIWFADAGQHALGLLTSLGSLVSFTLPAAQAGPEGVAVSLLGSVWVALSLVSQVAVRDPGGQTAVTTLSIGPSTPWSVGAAAPDPLGSVWVTEVAGRRLTVLTSLGSVTAAFSLPWGGTPRGIAVSRVGSVWFSDEAGNAIGLRTPDGLLVSFAVPTPSAGVWGVAVDAAGAVWFTETAGNKIGRLQDGAVTEFPIPTPNSRPGDLALDSTGAVWFAESAAGQLGRLSP